MLLYDYQTANSEMVKVQKYKFNIHSYNTRQDARQTHPLPSIVTNYVKFKFYWC